MAPATIEESIVELVEPRKHSLALPEPTRQRLIKAGVDLSNGYPYRPSAPLYIQDVYKIRDEERAYEDAGARADKSKKNLLSAATKVIDLTTHIGTEIVGLQLKDLTPDQRDELALLIAERSVVFFRDQDITPQQQKELGQWFGEIEIHVSRRRALSTEVLGADVSVTIAANTPGTWRTGSHCDLARSLPAGHPCRLPQPRRGFEMAQ